ALDQQRAEMLRQLGEPTPQEPEPQVAQSAPPAPAPQPVPQPSAVEQERAKYEAARRSLENLHNADANYRAAINEQTQIWQFINENYPPQYRTAAGWRELQRTDPARAQYIAEWIPVARQRYAELHQGIQTANTIAHAQQVQTRERQVQARQQWAEAEGAKF